VCDETHGVGLPSAAATLPTSPLAYDPVALNAGNGLHPNNTCVLNGFPTDLKTKKWFPFGVWFANATTVYVADEGNGTFKASDVDTVHNIYTTPSKQTTAGLQKWVLESGKWNLKYVLQNGLSLGVPYSVANAPGGTAYPTDTNTVTGLPWTPATDGLRNITGRLNSDGTATIYAITSTVSGNGEPGRGPEPLGRDYRRA